MRWYRRLILSLADRAENAEAKALREEIASLKAELAAASDQRDVFERQLDTEKKATGYWEMLYEKDFSEVVLQQAVNSRRTAEQERAIGREPEGPIAV